MIKFDLRFKNKPVKVHVTADGGMALYFEDKEYLILERISDIKYEISEGNYIPAKDDLVLLSRLLDLGKKEYERTHHFTIHLQHRKIEVEKNESARYYIKFPEDAMFMIARNKETGEWYQEQFNETLRPIADLQFIGQLIIKKEEMLMHEFHL